MLKQLKKELRELLDQRKQLVSERDGIHANAQDEKRDALTEDETVEFRRLTDEIRGVDDQVDELRGRIDELEDEAERQAAADALARQLDDGAEEREVVTAGRVQVVSEPRTYTERSGNSFFVDAFRAKYNEDPTARERLSRHAREVVAEGESERRDVGTSAFGGLVVPQYLVDEFAEVLRNGRATANAVRSLPLPSEGMSLVIPRGETGTSTAAQASENAAVSETNADFDNDLTVNVRTFAGQQDVSRQSLERGTAGIDRLIYADLVADYAETLDASIIADDGTSGTHKGILNATGINSVTYTDTGPTVAESYPKIADAVQKVASNRKLSANLIIMHPRRWGWFLSAVDSQNRPLVVPDAGAAVNAMGTAASNFGEGQLVGTLQGLPVLVDANIPTDLGTGSDEDRIIVARRQDGILWEEDNGMPRELRFEETNGGNLTVKLVVYGYSAFTAERYAKAFSVISGTGLVAPTF